MRLSHNLASLNIYRNQLKNNKTQSQALNNISTGYKVNSAKDDPNAIAKSERMRIQIRGVQMAARNAQDGIGMLQSSDGALDSVTSMLHRIRELTVQAGGATNDADREIIQNEINEMVKGIDNTVSNNEFNGVKLISTSNPDKVVMTSGANVDEKIEIPQYDLSSTNLGLVDGKKLSDLSVKEPSEIDEALSIVDGAMDQVLSVRSKYGALQNRFESLYNNLNSTGTVTEGAESKVRDADVAEEMMEYAKSGLLIEAGNALIVQTNKFPQEVLQILSRLK